MKRKRESGDELKTGLKCRATASASGYSAEHFYTELS
jgi:hypothetical protein